MSPTSKEESPNNFQQQPKLLACGAAMSRADAIIPAVKKKRNHPGNPYAEVVALSPKTLLATNRIFNSTGKVTTYHGSSSREAAMKLGRKCIFALRSPALRKDSFITQRAFCDALAEDNVRVDQSLAAMVGSLHGEDIFSHRMPSTSSSTTDIVGNFSGNNHSSDNHLKILSSYAIIASNAALLSNQMIPNDSGILFDGSRLNSPYMSLSSPHMTHVGNITAPESSRDQ
ncbi:hypothetical protein BAE44_0012545 [Dichanthelium oligosanthes]|uniref:BIRD-IDD transcription factor fourth C2HC zinc finger domain-containing protein n=1 Tax=Dichanthelium oligosanthes TaxID=888268 RepID=A0A1E5VMU1_9POAL|nr:hypothetical protein BAE44_0012545 [Dichanthelium oligosanthes]